MSFELMSSTSTKTYYINEALNIMYIDKNNQSQHKQIIFNKKRISHNLSYQIDYLKQTLESEILVIYDNNQYLNTECKNKYKQIINTNIDKKSILKYVTKYQYID